MTSYGQLTLEFHRGCREAFVELFERYREMIYAFFRRRVADAAPSEGLAQETFVAVLDGWLAAKCRKTPHLALRYGIATGIT